jgi:hypothetical protein
MATAPVGQPAPSPAPARAIPVSRAMVRPGVTMFQYIGPTALTAIGPMSGQRYEFSRTGAVVAVDPRDRASLATVPGLRLVESR